MDLTKFDYKTQYKDYLTTKKVTGPKLDLDHLVRLKYALVEGITRSQFAYSSDDEFYDFDVLVSSLPTWKKDAIAYLHHMPRSRLVGSATANPEWATLTPIFLWGMKEEHGIPYSSWKGEKLKFCFPSILWDSIEYARNWSRSDLMEEIGDISLARATVQTYLTGKKKGQRDALTSYKCNSLRTSQGGKWIPGMLLRIILQLWVANAAYRKPGVMILDPWDWDETPAALDDVEPVQTSRIKPKRSIEIEDLV